MVQIWIPFKPHQSVVHLTAQFCLNRLTKLDLQ